MSLLATALEAVPAVAKLIAKAIDAYTPEDDDERALVDQVRAMLPATSQTRKALDELEGKKTP
jgi:hypothetical protein